MPRVDTDTFYRNALARYGHNAQGAHWESARSQRVRFSVLRRLLPADLSALTLVDVGCGLGDLLRYLEVQGDRPGHYLGIDVVEPMVEIARARTGLTARPLVRTADPTKRTFAVGSAVRTERRATSGVQGFSLGGGRQG